MIGRITGKLIYKDNQKALIETQFGLAFYVFLPLKTLAKAEVNSTLSIYTHLHVKENELILYGFDDIENYHLFLVLLTVNSVGPKTAFNIISFFSPNELIDSIKNNNVDSLCSVPGLGKKTALKIIVELSQKFKQDFSFDKIAISEDDKLVIEALTSLGFKTKEIKTVLTKLDKNLTLEAKIKKALQIIKKV